MYVTSSRILIRYNFPTPQPCSNHGSVKHDRVASLRVKNCPADEIEWQTILDFVLKQQAPPDIHATAVVQEDSSISITIRKQIQGITVGTYMSTLVVFAC